MKDYIRKLFVIMGCIFVFSVMTPCSNINADEIEEPVEIEIDDPYVYVDVANCSLSISSGTATVKSKVTGKDGTSSTSVTVYLEKYTNGSWQSYSSWTHNGGKNQDNTDTTTVTHGTYRVRMYVVATAQGVGSESFNVDGNTVIY